MINSLAALIVLLEAPDHEKHRLHNTGSRFCPNVVADKSSNDHDSGNGDTFSDGYFACKSR